MRRVILVVALALGVALTLPAVAKEGDTFRPFVSYSLYEDSNLYRLSESEYGLVTHRSDQYGVLSAGMNVDWKVSRQRVIASASKNQVRFSRNPKLDYDGSDYSLKWNWQVGNYWSGQVGATENVTQSDLSNQLGLPISNQLTRENRFFNADWWFHPRWSAGVGTAISSTTNSATQQATLDYEDTSVTATLVYRTPKGSSVRGQFRRVSGEYPNRSAGLFVDRAHAQTEASLLADWRVSGKLIARGQVGHVQRSNQTDILSRRNFSGVTGRLSADYFPTGKTMLNWAVYREVGNSDDVDASYQVNSGTSLGAAWSIQPKLTLRTNASFENRAFEGDTGYVVKSTPRRNEDTLSGSLSLSYTPIPMATIDVGLQAGRRESNITVNEYTFHKYFLNFRADF